MWVAWVSELRGWWGYVSGVGGVDFVGTSVAWVKNYIVKWMTWVYKILRRVKNLAWVGISLYLAQVQNPAWFENLRWFRNLNWYGSKLKRGLHKLEFFLLFLIITPNNYCKKEQEIFILNKGSLPAVCFKQRETERNFSTPRWTLEKKTYFFV